MWLVNVVLPKGVQTELGEVGHDRDQIRPPNGTLRTYPMKDSGQLAVSPHETSGRQSPSCSSKVLH